MKNKFSSIDVSMLIKKYYCHQCGDRLVKNPRTRIITPQDPEHKKYRIGHSRVVGDVEFTEYDFKCNNCDKIISCDEQYVIDKIQKKLKKRVLSEEELSKNDKQVRLAIEKKKKIMNIIVSVIFFTLALIVLYFAIKTNGFSFKFYF